MIQKTLKLGSIALCLCSFAHANQYWDQYSKAPVEIKQMSNGSVQNLSFVDFKNSMLVAELPGGVGEISLPATPSMMQNLRLELKGLDRVPALIEQQNYEGALSTLRPVVYPLIKFHQVPGSFTQLHSPIYALMDTLLAAGELNEAEFILSKIQLELSPPRYSQIAINLMNAFISKEQFDKAGAIAQSIPVEGQYTSNISPIINATDALRAAGLYQAVIPLYRSIRTSVPDNLKQNIDMWLAYSLSLNNETDEATEIFNSLSEPAPNDRLYSLYKLLEGSRAYREEAYGLALDVLTRGFVRAQASYSWVPEMLYLIGDCYLRNSDNVAAKNVWTEVVTLYPDSPWAERSDSAIQTLPQP